MYYLFLLIFLSAPLFAMQEELQIEITVLDQKVEDILGKNHCLLLSGKDKNDKTHVVQFYAENIYNKPAVIETAEAEFRRHIESKKCPGC